MRFDPLAYGPDIAGILAKDGDGQRLIPLVAVGCSTEVRSLMKTHTPASLFRQAEFPDAAMAGLWAYFSDFDEAHGIAQDISTVEGSFWHGILHRQEPDASNAAYWFRRVATHPIFPALAEAASEILTRYPKSGFRVGSTWDPFEFVFFCERAQQQRGSAAEAAALEIQRAEWQLLFDYCARPRA